MGFLFIYAADFAAGEYRNRTYAAGFLCGYPRKVLLWAKAVAYFTGLIPFLLIHAVTGTVMWTIQSKSQKFFPWDEAAPWYSHAADRETGVFFRRKMEYGFYCVLCA